MRVRLAIGVSAVVLVASPLAAVAAGGGKPGTTGGGGTPAWTPPVVLGGGGAEPSIRNPLVGSVMPAAYVAAPTGAGSNFWWIDERANADGSHTFLPSAPQQPDLGTGGGDAEISVGNAADPATGCATIAYSGLHNIDLLNNFTADSSRDCGHSWPNPPNLYATQNTLTDRQWQTFDGARTNFLLYHKVDTSQIVVSRSDDGGQTYTEDATGILGIGGIIDAATMPAVANMNQVGNITTDYATPIAGLHHPSGDQVHRLYAIFAGPRDVADNLAAQADQTWNHNDTIYVARSDDGGHTWVDHVAYRSFATGRELNLLFPVVTVDSGGTVYAAWSDQFHVQYAFSRDGGVTWSPARQVNTDNPTQQGTATLTAPTPGNADVFPWIAGGGPGRLDVVWYHGTGGAPGSESVHRDPGDASTRWTVAFAQLAGANTSKPTVTSYSDAVSPVIHTGDICQNGLNCDVLGGDRTLLDFFQVSIDKAGRANIVYATDASSPGSASVAYIRQNTGLSAWDGSKLKGYAWTPLQLPQGTSCPGPQVVDFAGDAPSSLLINPTGGNLDSEDFTAVDWSAPAGSSDVTVTMTFKNLASTPAAGTASTLWEATWAYAGRTWYAEATSNGPGLQSYDVGYLDATASEVSTGSPTGVFTEGSGGTIAMTFPRSALSDPAAGISVPADGAVFSAESAVSHSGFTVLGTGVYYTAVVDRAPDSGSGSAFTVGAC